MKFLSEDAVKVEHFLYMFSKDINMLYAMDLDNGDVFPVSRLPGEDMFQKKLIGKMLYWNNKLFLIPLRSKSIWVYSLGSKIWEKIDIVDYENNWSKSYFKNAVIYKEFVYIFGGYYPAILIMNLNSYEIEYIKEPFVEKKNTVVVRDLYFRGEPYQKDSLLYFACSVDNTVFQFDMEKRTFVWKKVGDKKNRYSGIIWNGNEFILAPRHDTEIVRWDGKDKWSVYRIKEQESTQRKTYGGIIKKGNKFIIPGIDKWTDTMVIGAEGDISFEKTQYTFFKTIEDEYFIQDINGIIYQGDHDGNEKLYKCLMDKDAVSWIKEENTGLNSNNAVLFQEGEPFSLKEWLSIVFDESNILVEEGRNRVHG